MASVNVLLVLLVLSVSSTVINVGARCTPLGMWGCTFVRDCCWSVRGATCHIMPGQRTGLCTENMSLGRGHLCVDNGECCSNSCYYGRMGTGICK